MATPRRSTGSRSPRIRSDQVFVRPCSVGILTYSYSPFYFPLAQQQPSSPPPPRSPMVKLCWALQESNEGTANQRGSRCEGAYKITILGSKTIGCVCGEGKKKWIWRNSVEQEEAGKESEQRRRKEWEEWEQGDGRGGGIFFSLLDKSVLRVRSPLRVALPKSCLSNKN